MVDLFYSETVYLDLFGKNFENKIDMEHVQKPGIDGRRYSKIFRDNKRKRTIENEQQKYPIKYYVDYMFPSVTDQKELKKRFTMLTEYLAKTTDLEMFNSPLIQRYIDFQWKSKWIWKLRGLLISHIICCICIMINISVLDYDFEAVSNMRLFNNILVSVIVLITVPFFEIRQMIQEGWQYFTDFWNINDILFLIVLTATVITDTKYDTTRTVQKVNPITNDLLVETMVLQKTKEVQITRICYALLAIISFVKLLSLLRIFDNISFIIKMLFRVGKELTPFLFIFIMLVGTFGIVVVALDLDKE